MAIIRVKHQRNFTCLDNRPIRDERLTLQARALHNQMLTYPDDWDFNLTHLAAVNPQDSKRVISKALRELEEFDYVIKKPKRTSCGKFDGWEYFVYELPDDQKPAVSSPNTQKRQVGLPNDGEPIDGLPQVQKRQVGERSFGLPCDGSRKVGFREHIINNEINEILINEILSPPNPLTGEERKKKCEVKSEKPEIDLPTTEEQKSYNYQPSLATSEKKCSAPPQAEVVTTLTTVKYDPALGIRPPRQRPKFRYPDGPWLNERGCISEDFLRDRANLWRTGDTQQSKAFGAMALEDVIGLVAGHYQKTQNHAKLETDWAAYVAKCGRYVGNVHLRVSNGVSVDASEQQEVLRKIPALLTEPVEPIFESMKVQDDLEAKNNIIAFPSKKPSTSLSPARRYQKTFGAKLKPPRRLK
jgi:hypothetical protein